MSSRFDPPRSARRAAARAGGVRASVCLAPLLAAALAGAGGAAVAQTGEPAVIEAIELEADGAGRAEIRIFTSAELDLVGIRVAQGDQLALQLPRHLPGPGVEDLLPAEGLIRAVRAAVEDTSRGPLTRIIVSPRRPVAHDLAADGSRLRLRLWAADAEPEEAALRRRAAELEAALGAAERSRDELAERLEKMERRQRELDATLTATLGEVTEALRGLRAKTEEMSLELRRAGGRESRLNRRVAQLEASLAESEKARAELAARLERQAAPPARAPTVRLGAMSPEGLAVAPAVPPATPAAPAGDGTSLVVSGYRFVVAASANEESAARALSARLRRRGYPSEVYSSTDGYYVVTVDRLPKDEARRRLDDAVREGDVDDDAYLIYGKSLRSKIAP